jgi:predicted aspartyl protease
VRTSQVVAMALMVLGAVAPDRAAAADRTRPSTVRFASSQPGEVVIPVFIRGEGPYRFLLDTGSSHSVISQTLATTLGLVAVAQAPMATSVGSVLTPVVRLSEVAVGAARVESLFATSLPERAAGTLGDGISGVIGQDFLSQFDYTLDYRSSRLSWNDRVQVEPGVRLTLERSGGRFLVQLPPTDRRSRPTRFVPDSGAAGVVLFAGTAADSLPIDVTRVSTRVSTLLGERAGRRVIVRAMPIGPATLWDLPAVSVVLPDGTTEDGDGLLPLSLFARVSFYQHEGLMVVRLR